jgi:hypothetical protein
MPLKYDERSFLPMVSLQGWKDGETRTYAFLDDGVDYTGEFGLTFIYKVESHSSKGLGTTNLVQENLFVRPKGPLAIGLTSLLSKDLPSLKGLKVDITKVLGEKQKDTRYNCEVVDE